MKVLAIGWVNTRRMLRERSNLFFVFILPIAIVLLVGAQFGGEFRPLIGVVAADDPLAEAVVSALDDEEAIDVLTYPEETLLVRAVERGVVQGGVIVADGMWETAARGEPVRVEYLARPDQQQLREVVSSVVARVMAPVGAAQYAARHTGASFQEAFRTARASMPSEETIEVEVATLGEALFPPTLGRFDLGASQQLVLFVFLTALAGSSSLILTRQLGLSRRMLSTPTRVGTIVAGEAAGRFGVALTQGVYIMVATTLMFGVGWGDPLAAVALLVALSAVGAAAGMLMGATFENDQQAAGIGVMAALGLGALGGSMLPIELFSPTMRTVAHLTPHAWALDGFAELVRHGGTVVDVAGELGVLFGYAAVIGSVAAWRLRKAITT